LHAHAGQRLRVRLTDGRMLTGIAAGLAEDGGLQLQTRSGLRAVRTTTRENKIPGLGDLPVLGWMFKNHRSQQEMTDLYFFITPEML